MTSVSIFDENESLIYDLYMNQHLTSKEIAEKTGCNRNGLKAFITRKGWKRKFIKTCLFCGKQFETDREHSKFCSEECRLKKVGKDIIIKYRRPESGMRVCENCGKEYYFDINVPSYYKEEGQKTGVNAARFCSYECGREFGWKKEQNINRERYGHVCSVHGEEVKEKVKKTLMEHYGVDVVGKSKEVQERIKQTNLERYGVENTFKSKEMREKAQATVLKKYGVENVFQNEEIKAKSRQTRLERYGYEYTLQSKEMMDKIQSNAVKQKMFETKKKNGTLFHSNLEKQVDEFVKSLGFTTETLRMGKGNTCFEIDVFVPDKKIGIEFNGVWFHSQNIGRHSEQGSRSKNYHFDKFLTAKEKGIALIQIWEDQWLLKRDIIEDILRARLGVVGKERTLYARQCTVEEIDVKTYRKFCEENHTQGYRTAEIRLGLFYENELVQIASFDKCKDYGKRKSQAEWEWIRGCPASNNLVIGGTSKLFSHFVKQYDPESVLCYADCNLFDGKGYEKCGFDFIGYTGPDKFYVERNTFKRRARNPYKYREYKQLVEENKLYECYGAGSLKFMWRKQSNESKTMVSVTERPKTE